ncbi:fumarylacetoacetate hydrolase family protein [Alicyclobacillus ferrooxydans]|uniref:5-carboxymethyl-2-hydroxymuconate isomerase n=1 Tax=Alicyclobacillus ferrooxydans TaxID=471514 RepID=A0A0P9CDI0_9BACL|nr:fumarylacetoacetate hydrolase family protein [Alicyclobacillus ferrooxydans]KPV43795.1 5-carboxymethyl-2-hydroxymuconate isomerase [Alicyclobacillus ferrooxydans]
MKLITYQSADRLQLGVVDEELGVLDVASASKEFNAETTPTLDTVCADMGHGVAVLTDLLDKAKQAPGKSLFLDESTLVLGPSVPRTGKIICVGLNYRRHAIESNLPLPEVPLLFSKYQNSLAAHNEEILLPTNSSECDYEAELAIVIGKQAKCIDKESAKDYVLGYTNANDLSARDLQFRTSQWLLGKSCDGFCPVGPYLVTKDEVPNPDNLYIRCYVNGELRQNSNTSDLVFPCDEIISFASHYMTLEPGDIILTGTPEGVAMGYPKGQRPWLHDGDEVVVEVEKLGRLVNRMKRV